jgi:proliferating cell nuclear antigen
MKLTLAEPKLLKESITIISELVNEARFSITTDAVELIAMDPANVAMVIFRLLSSNFVEYEVKEATEITLNLANLKQILKRAGANDTLTLEISKENKLKVIIKGKGQKTFHLPILESEEREQKVPDLSFLVTVKMPCSILNDAIEDADIVADAATFIADDKKLELRAEGDLSKVNVEIPGDEDVKIITHNIQEKVKAKYSLEYLKKIMAGSKLTDEVAIHFSKDYPIKLDYRAIDKVELSFILAPRVEEK